MGFFPLCFANPQAQRKIQTSTSRFTNVFACIFHKPQEFSTIQILQLGNIIRHFASTLKEARPLFVFVLCARVCVEYFLSCSVVHFVCKILISMIFFPAYLCKTSIDQDARTWLRLILHGRFKDRSNARIWWFWNGLRGAI